MYKFFHMTRDHKPYYPSVRKQWFTCQRSHPSPTLRRTAVMDRCNGTVDYTPSQTAPNPLGEGWYGMELLGWFPTIPTSSRPTRLVTWHTSGRYAPFYKSVPHQVLCGPGSDKYALSYILCNLRVPFEELYLLCKKLKSFGWEVKQGISKSFSTYLSTSRQHKIRNKQMPHKN